jgi:hypothetical protein
MLTKIIRKFCELLISKIDYKEKRKKTKEDERRRKKTKEDERRQKNECKQRKTQEAECKLKKTKQGECKLNKTKKYHTVNLKKKSCNHAEGGGTFSV